MVIVPRFLGRLLTVGSSSRGSSADASQSVHSRHLLHAVVAYRKRGLAAQGTGGPK